MTVQGLMIYSDRLTTSQILNIWLWTRQKIMKIIQNSMTFQDIYLKSAQAGGVIGQVKLIEYVVSLSPL